MTLISTNSFKTMRSPKSHVLKLFTFDSLFLNSRWYLSESMQRWSCGTVRT